MIKLSRITARYYIVFITILFIAGGFFMLKTIRDSFFLNLDKVLTEEKHEIYYSIKNQKLAEHVKFSANVLIEHVEDNKLLPDKFTTTSGIDPFKNEQLEYRVLTSYFKQDSKVYKIVILQEVSESIQNINRNYLWSALGILILILIGFTLVNQYINKSTWSPFYQLLDQLKNYDVTAKKQIVLQKTSIQEFQELNRIIEILLERISLDYDTQKEFIENSSHELKTPLAVITQRLDMLIQSENLKEIEMEHIQSIFDWVKKLKNLNQNLTLLFKIENKHYQNVQNLDLIAVLKQHFSQFKYLAEDRNLDFKFFTSESTFFIEINPSLLDVLISNLLSNAIKHNHHKGFLSVHFKNMTLEIINTSNSIVKDPQKMFQRFAKGGNEESSVGLGLAIVKKIAEFYHLEVSYEVFENLHSFRIQFISVVAKV